MQYRDRDNADAQPSHFSSMKIIAAFQANYFCKEVDDKKNNKNYNSLPIVDYEIDYIKVFKLICNESNTSITQGVGSTYNFNNYVYGVKSNIKFGGAGCTAKVTNGMNVSLRAKNSIELLEGFEVEAGGEFYANICDCTN